MQEKKISSMKQIFSATTMQKKVEKQRKNIVRMMKLFLYATVATIIMFIVTFITAEKEIKIKDNAKITSLKTRNSSIISQDVIITYFFKNNEKITVKSSNADVRKNNINLLKNCHITTQRLRNKIYRGKTDLIKIDNYKNTFFIPKKIYLTNNSNGQNNYISAKNISGSFSNEIKSDYYFAIKDDDIFLSGNNFFISCKKNYLKIDNNPHLIYTKKTKSKNNEQIYDIRSKKMQFFGNDNIAIFNKNVDFLHNNNLIQSQFAKVYFNQEKRPTDIFVYDKVSIVNLKNSITADYGYFDVANDIILMYQNVNVTSKEKTSSGEFYLYDIKKKTTISFTENTAVPKKEQNRIYNILKKISKELDEEQSKHIDDVIENSKKNAAIKALYNNGDNYNIDRTKRTKISIAS